MTPRNPIDARAWKLFGPDLGNTDEPNAVEALRQIIADLSTGRPINPNTIRAGRLAVHAADVQAAMNRRSPYLRLVKP